MFATVETAQYFNRDEDRSSTLGLISSDAGTRRQHLLQCHFGQGDNGNENDNAQRDGVRIILIRNYI